MAAISVNDELMMCFALHDWLIGVVNIHEWYLWECKIASFLTNFSLQTATYQVLAMTIDKYIAMKWPHKATAYSASTRVRFVLIGIYIFAIIYNIPHLSVASLLREECLSYLVGGTITKVYSWLTFLVKGIIPFSMLIYMNYVIVQTVRKSRKMFSVCKTDAGKENTADIRLGMETRERTMKSAENQLTLMLLLVTILFSILLIPTYIRFIYSTFAESDTPEKFAKSLLFYQITYKLYTTNSGINFFLYCISGRKFRSDLKQLFSYSRSFFSIQKPIQNHQLYPHQRALTRYKCLQEYKQKDSI